ncbi:hypothetical protein K438DRAFT_1777540 [Mycena galopus ATCC 62051]|nr:hypothetical protein K438DRAFT_1777540 [Mycena galopus ATCC 62051]
MFHTNNGSIEPVRRQERSEIGNPLNSSISNTLNSRGQEQDDQIGSKELSENVTGPSNSRGKGARILAFYFRDGDSAAVRKAAAQWENNRGVARNVLRVYRMGLGMVSSAEELLQMGRLGKIGEEKPTEIEPHGAIAPLSEQNIKVVHDRSRLEI